MQITDIFDHFNTKIITGNGTFKDRAFIETTRVTTVKAETL